VIPGDGIGPEVADAAVRVLDAVAEKHGLPVDFVWFDLGAEKYLREGVTMPQPVFESLRDEYAAILLGAMGDPRVPDNKHAEDILLGLRMRLDLYVNERPARLLHPRLTPLKDKTAEHLDFVVLRENTEDLYVGMGGVFKKDTPDEIATNEMIATRKGVERIVRYAFELARTRRGRVCMSDKSNVLRYAHGLWRRVFAQVGAEYPDVKAEHLYADVCAMEMVKHPERFDVIVTSNMLGDILSDLSAELVGGLGLAASANLHPGRVSLFEPVHGSAPNIAGKDAANPLAMILTGARMFEYLGWGEPAAAIERAVVEAIRRDLVTPDLGGQLGTQACGEQVAAIFAADA
jgi:3-isopropylmalate dehydrogenase